MSERDFLDEQEKIEPIVIGEGEILLLKQLSEQLDKVKEIRENIKVFSANSNLLKDKDLFERTMKVFRIMEPRLNGVELRDAEKERWLRELSGKIQYNQEVCITAFTNIQNQFNILSYRPYLFEDEYEAKL